MSISKTFWENQKLLLKAFHIASIFGIRSTWERCEKLGTTPQEPDFVAGIVLESTPVILSALSAVLSSRRVSVSMCSVFCHQTPQVTFGPTPSATCELGDILFAYVHTPRHGMPRRNAILFQAKASARQPYPVRKSEGDQLRLYLEWPDFIYPKSFLNGQSRSITPKAPHSGAQYLLIDDRPPSDPESGLLDFPGTYPVGCCMPDELLFDHNDLALELFNLLTFRSGRPFDKKTLALEKQDWSNLVWDILETGVKKTFNRKNSGWGGTGRSVGDATKVLDGMSFARASSRLSCTTVGDILGQRQAGEFFDQGDNIPPKDRPPVRDRDGPEGEGVSVVLIETSEPED